MNRDNHNGNAEKIHQSLKIDIYDIGVITFERNDFRKEHDHGR